MRELLMVIAGCICLLLSPVLLYHDMMTIQREGLNFSNGSLLALDTAAVGFIIYCLLKLLTKGTKDEDSNP